MEVKTLIVRNDQKLFEKRCEEYLKEGYKLHTSTLLQDKLPSSSIEQTIKSTVKYYENKNTKEFYFYALLIKE